MSAELDLSRKSFHNLLLQQEYDTITQNASVQEARKNALVSDAVFREVAPQALLDELAVRHLSYPVKHETIQEHFMDYKKEEWLPREIVSDNVIQGYAINWENTCNNIYTKHPLQFYRVSIVMTNAEKIGVCFQKGGSNNNFKNKELYDRVQSPDFSPIVVSSLFTQSERISESALHLPILNERKEFDCKDSLFDTLFEELRVRLDDLYWESIAPLQNLYGFIA